MDNAEGIDNRELRSFYEKLLNLPSDERKQIGITIRDCWLTTYDSLYRALYAGEEASFNDIKRSLIRVINRVYQNMSDKYLRSRGMLESRLPFLNLVVEHFKVPVVNYKDADKGSTYEKHEELSCSLSTQEAESMFHVNREYPSLITLNSDGKTVKYHAKFSDTLRGRATESKVGKYLKKVSTLADHEIADIVNNVNITVNFIDNGVVDYHYTREAIRNVYSNGPSSCMKSKGYNGVLSAECYATADCGVASITVNGRIVARCVLNSMNKTYSVIYGNVNLLSTMLERDGWISDEDLDGCRLLRIEEDGNILCPYIDGSATQVDLECDSLLITSYGGYDGQANICGILHKEDRTWCNGCDEYHDDDDMEDTSDGYRCSNCRAYYYRWSSWDETYISTDCTIYCDISDDYTYDSNSGYYEAPDGDSVSYNSDRYDEDDAKRYLGVEDEDED